MTGAAIARRAFGIAIAALALVPAALRAQLRVGAAGEARYVQHRVNAGNGVGLSSGSLFGGRAMVGIGTHVEVSASVAQGSLTADSAIANDEDLARGEATVTVLPVPYLGIRVGAEQHTFTLPNVAVQRWTSARIGGEARLAFHGGMVTSLLRFDFYPTVSVSGITKPNTAFGGASGIVFRSGVVHAAITYELERYDFPQSGGVTRHEQVSYLVGTVGLILGRRH
jgi:hypothetical protein